jgi:hypothetical protein
MHPTNDGSTAAAAAALTTSLDLCARIPIPVDGLEVTRCRRSRPIDRLFFLTPNPLLAPPRAGVMEPRAVARQRPDVFNGITRNQWPIIFQGPLLSLPLSLSLSLSLPLCRRGSSSGSIVRVIARRAIPDFGARESDRCATERGCGLRGDVETSRA